MLKKGFSMFPQSSEFSVTCNVLEHTLQEAENSVCGNTETYVGTVTCNVLEVFMYIFWTENTKTILHSDIF